MAAALAHSSFRGMSLLLGTRSPLRVAVASHRCVAQTNTTNTMQSKTHAGSIRTRSASAAVVRGVPSSFAHCLKFDDSAVIDYENAVKQHAAYVKCLQQKVPKIIELPADDRFPDCSFVEDTAVVIGDRAMIARPGARERQGEEADVKEALKHCGLRIYEAKPPACIDGGDVLVTDEHIFVGRSRRTNHEGIAALQAAFPDIPVFTIPSFDPILIYSPAHSLCHSIIMTWVEGNTLLVEDSPGALEMFEALRQMALSGGREYESVLVPDAGGANALVVDDTVFYPAAYSPDTAAVYQSLKGKRAVAVDISEFHKGDGGLTCLSVLV
eukprot:jgi/Chlat1/4699/Chrsp3S00442